LVNSQQEAAESKKAGKGSGKKGRPPATRKRGKDEEDDDSPMCSADEREWEEEQNRSLEMVEDDEGFMYEGRVGKKGEILRKDGRSGNATASPTSEEECNEDDDFENFQAKKRQNSVKMFGKGRNSLMAEIDEDGDFF
jgi:hypothetical protein